MLCPDPSPGSQQCPHLLPAPETVLTPRPLHLLFSLLKCSLPRSWVADSSPRGPPTCCKSLPLFMCFLEEGTHSVPMLPYVMLGICRAHQLVLQESCDKALINTPLLNSRSFHQPCAGRFLERSHLAATQPLPQSLPALSISPAGLHQWLLSHLVLKVQMCVVLT